MKSLDGKTFAGIGWLDIVVSAYNFWKDNGRTNPTDKTQRFNSLVDHVASSGNAFAPGADAPGVWSIPVCTETQYADNMQKYYMSKLTENWNCNPKVRKCLEPCPNFPCC
jgi:hypothetical protein